MTHKIAVAAAAAAAAAVLLVGVWGIRALTSPGRQSPAVPGPNQPTTHEERSPGRPWTPEEEASAIPVPKGGKTAPRGPDDPSAPSAGPAGR